MNPITDLIDLYKKISFCEGLEVGSTVGTWLSPSVTSFNLWIGLETEEPPGSYISRRVTLTVLFFGVDQMSRKILKYMVLHAIEWKDKERPPVYGLAYLRELTTSTSQTERMITKYCLGLAMRFFKASQCPITNQPSISISEASSGEKVKKFETLAVN